MTDLQKLIDSSEAVSKLDSLLKKHELTDSKAQVYVVLQKVVSGEIPTEDIMWLLDQALKGNPKAISLSSDLYKELFESHKRELDDLYESKKKPFTSAIKEIKEKLKLSFSQERLDHRFDHIAQQYLTNEYDRDRALRTLMKGTKPGGLEMKEEQAKAVMNEFDSLMGRVKFGTSQEIQKDSTILQTPPLTNVKPQKQEVQKKPIKKEPDSPAVQKLKAALTPVKDGEKIQDDYKSATFKVPGNLPFEKKENHLEETVTEKIEVKAEKPVQKPFVKEKKQKPISVKAPTETVKTVAKLKEDDLLDGDEHKELLEIDEKIRQHVSSIHNDIGSEVQEKLAEVINESKVSFKDKDLEKRFHSTVISRLKDARNAYATRDVVMKPIKKGGLGLDVDQAQVFLRLLEDKNDELNSIWRAREKEKKQSYLEEKRHAMFERDVSKPPTPVKKRTTDMAAVVRAQKKPNKVAVVAKTLKTAKPKMHDVKAGPKMLDPIGELKSYSIVDFERLNKDPKEAIIKVEAKIDLLGQEAFIKKKKGARAWRESEVMRVYRDQLRQSIMGNLTLSKVIEERKKAGQPVLNEKQVDALTELSARLRA